MGYYIHFKTKELKIKSVMPIEVIDFINAHVNNKDYFGTTPDHKFFTLERWDGLFGQHAFVEQKTYFIYKNGFWRLFINCEINYGREEIEEFAKWIEPYISGHKPKEFIGNLEGEERNDKNNVYIERALLKKQAPCIQKN